jgi:hypothetical protein
MENKTRGILLYLWLFGVLVDDMLACSHLHRGPHFIITMHIGIGNRETPATKLIAPPYPIEVTNGTIAADAPTDNQHLTKLFAAVAAAGLPGHRSNTNTFIHVPIANSEPPIKVNSVQSTAIGTRPAVSNPYRTREPAKINAKGKQTWRRARSIGASVEMFSQPLTIGRPTLSMCRFKFQSMSLPAVTAEIIAPNPSGKYIREI